MESKNKKILLGGLGFITIATPSIVVPILLLNKESNDIGPKLEIELPATYSVDDHSKAQVTAYKTQVKTVLQKFRADNGGENGLPIDVSKIDNAQTIPEIIAAFDAINENSVWTTDVSVNASTSIEAPREIFPDDVTPEELSVYKKELISEFEGKYVLRKKYDTLHILSSGTIDDINTAFDEALATKGVNASLPLPVRPEAPVVLTHTQEEINNYREAEKAKFKDKHTSQDEIDTSWITGSIGEMEATTDVILGLINTEKGGSLPTVTRPTPPTTKTQWSQSAKDDFVAHIIEGVVLLNLYRDKELTIKHDEKTLESEIHWNHSPEGTIERTDEFSFYDDEGNDVSNMIIVFADTIEKPLPDDYTEEETTKHQKELIEYLDSATLGHNNVDLSKFDSLNTISEIATQTLKLAKDYTSNGGDDLSGITPNEEPEFSSHTFSQIASYKSKVNKAFSGTWRTKEFVDTTGIANAQTAGEATLEAHKLAINHYGTYGDDLSHLPAIDQPKSDTYAPETINLLIQRFKDDFKDMHVDSEEGDLIDVTVFDGKTSYEELLVEFNKIIATGEIWTNKIPYETKAMLPPEPVDNSYHEATINLYISDVKNTWSKHENKNTFDRRLDKLISEITISDKTSVKYMDAVIEVATQVKNELSKG